MNVLVINNHTRHLSDLTASLDGHDVEIREYHPVLDLECGNKDLIILSGGGGEGLEIHDEHQPGQLWYDNQMKFIRNCQKPIIGICMGFEVIARTFGAKVEKMTAGLEKFIEVETTAAGQQLFSKKRLKQFEAHDWCVQEAPDDFDVLASSETGLEIIRHKTRPIIATQFHPEKGGTIELGNLVANAF